MARIKTIRGTNGDNTLRGKAVNERILGYGGDDRLNGSGGNDELLGGAGEDLLEGSLGNDRLDGGEGDDRLAGGSGDDFYILTDGDLILERQGGGIDTIQADYSVGLLTHFENIVLVGSKALRAAGNDGKNTLTGNNAANFLSGGRGNDTLIGNGGNDSLDGGVGRDLMTGGLGNDTYGIDNLRDRVNETFNQGEDTVRTVVNYSLATVSFVENLVLVGNAFDGEGNNLDNNLAGNSGNNILRGGLGDDEIDGQAGVDSLFGDDGDDELDGNAGSDTLSGGAGDDSLIGGTGDDQLVGGAGADEFVYDAGQPFNTTTVVGQDIISDFTAGIDSIVLHKDTFTFLRSSAGGTGFSVSSEFASVDSDSDVRSSRAVIVYSEQTGRLFYHPGGVGAGSAIFATLSGIPNLSANDFTIDS